ncbi:Snaclec 8 [Orchesella cincta]|uniref:Snaclec 8 n=1 Tax=Orchesella cincta TaxID=48709 RepID=A0A1D2MTA8_ORCCI|nr:Snaclec 8 [Orchesella cincta]
MSFYWQFQGQGNWFLLELKPTPFHVWGFMRNEYFIEQLKTDKTLRFRSVVEATTSVFEQNLSVIIRPDCYLLLKVEDNTQLTLDSLWSPKTDNRGLNCTVFIVPKKNFGLEVKLSSLSVYGMRDICKGRFLQFTRPKRIPYNSPGSTSGRAGGSSTVYTASPNVESELKYNQNNNFVENIHFALNNPEERQPQAFSPLERKFCGKLEDYLESERTLTFPSSESTLLSSSTSFTLDNFDNEIPGILSNNIPTTKIWGIYLSVKLPVAVKVREGFAFDLTALSPCQRVTLNGLEGELKYSKHYENEQCSVVIHVPYGNTILTQIAVSSDALKISAPEENPIRSDIISSVTSVNVLSSESPELGNLDPDISVPISNESVANWAQNYNSSNINNTNYVTEATASSKKDQQPDNMYFNTEALDNSIPLPPSSTSYECPVSLQLNELETNGINGGLLPLDPAENEDDDGRKQQLLQNQKYLLIQAVDMVSGSEFNWCFDASKQNAAHKRAWKSSGNRVSINFRLSHFDTFILNYESLKIPELVGDCERGWVKVDDACVTVVEKLVKWTDAEESCQLRGGHLVTIKNEHNEKKLEKLIKESPLFLPSRAYWIGANDRESEGNFQWTSGLAFHYKSKRSI